MALPLVRLHDFQAGDPILDSEVDDEFNNILTEVNLLPEKNSTLQTNLNADLLDGLHAVDISAAAFPAGTKLLFYQAAPPSGWTLVAAPTDHILTWKSGATGGTNAANSWTISGLSVTVNGHAISVAELPSHTHNINHGHSLGGPATNVLRDVSPVGSFGPDLTTGADTFTAVTTLTVDAFAGSSAATGSGTTHTHTGSASQNGTWRPPAAYVIIASKD